MSALRWGIIGCGAVTERKSGPAYQQTPGFTLAAVMRRDAALAADYAQRHGVPRWFDDADALINDPDIDAVYIATPPDTHLHYARKVAAAGKPCCVEKPMAPSHAECLAMLAAFEQAGVPLFVAYYRRSLPRFEQVRAWLAEGRIGAPRHIHWQLARTPGPDDLAGTYRWRTDASIAPGGYFDDLASHGLDLFCHFFGKVAQATGSSTNQQGLYSARDAVAASWIYRNGVTGSGSWHFGSFERADRVEITGSGGKIVFSVFDEHPLQLITAGGVENMEIANPPHIQLHHVANMCAHLSGGARHPSCGDSAAHTAWMMDCILGKSAA
ncbi:Gfo/Idh/MocA family oxidoreductase [Herbaspirillum sp. LeCh32-8]|uniref:Gfo/Idh/MocA family protein n=1 Tax=Herbaspirillum sp. LeCh32-8 TaxID=2821356 RepID=UPI001AEB2685|nr:Gfo/Idh/MocA family oxidoreductase [Herbaspirillum sp. LeCh32-8]MBP0600208.1 Gfo/Idh/MocA family oxidoreductase [Herbaspirillum sp. LeCh32-8]